MDIKNIFCERISKLFEGQTDAEVAKKINDIPQNCGNWRKGRTMPKLEALQRIAMAYNVNSDYLLGLTKEPTSNKDMQGTCEFTGLSEQALHQILNIKNAPFKALVKNGRCTTEITAPDSFNENLLGICDNFISDAKFIEFLQKILLLKQISSDNSKSDLSESIPDTVINQIHNDGYFILNRTDFEQVLKFQISELCRDIVNDICESKVDEPPKKKRCRKATQKDFDTF